MAGSISAVSTKLQREDLVPAASLGLSALVLAAMTIGLHVGLPKSLKGRTALLIGGPILAALFGIGAGVAYFRRTPAGQSRAFETALSLSSDESLSMPASSTASESSEDLEWVAGWSSGCRRLISGIQEGLRGAPRRDGPIAVADWRSFQGALTRLDRALARCDAEHMKQILPQDEAAHPVDQELEGLNKNLRRIRRLERSVLYRWELATETAHQEGLHRVMDQTSKWLTEVAKLLSPPSKTPVDRDAIAMVARKHRKAAEVDMKALEAIRQ